MQTSLMQVAAESMVARIAMFNYNQATALLEAKELEAILKSRPEVLTMPTVVLTVSGVARSGKSFLLNLIANLLEYMEQVSHSAQLTASI